MDREIVLKGKKQKYVILALEGDKMAGFIRVLFDCWMVTDKSNATRFMSNEEAKRAMRSLDRTYYSFTLREVEF